MEEDMKRAAVGGKKIKNYDWRRKNYWGI